DRGDLPCGVVHPDLAALRRTWSLRADAEQAQIVVVVAATGAQKDSLRTGHLDDRKAEDVAIKRERALGVAYPQHHVVQALDGEVGHTPDPSAFRVPRWRV